MNVKDRKRAMSAADLLANECVVREMDSSGSPWDQLSRIIAWERDHELYEAYSEDRTLLSLAAGMLAGHGEHDVAEALIKLRDGKR